jgi:hypothetical protein
MQPVHVQITYIAMYRGIPHQRAVAHGGAFVIVPRRSHDSRQVGCGHAHRDALHLP